MSDRQTAGGQHHHRCACCGGRFDEAPPRVVEDINGKELAFCSEKCEYAQMGVPVDG
jgi:hypothetical protein